MANAMVSLNGVELITHADGYTPFEARLTGRLQPGDNTVTVEIDGSENPEIPPFGGDTVWANGALAYRMLSPAMQAMLRPLKVRMSARNNLYTQKLADG